MMSPSTMANSRESEGVVTAMAYLFRAARISYNQMTLISRSTVLNSGFPVYISAFSASPVLRQNNPPNIFSTTFNSPASSDKLGRRELYSEVDPATALVPAAIPKDQLFVLRCSELRP